MFPVRNTERTASAYFRHQDDEESMCDVVEFFTLVYDIVRDILLDNYRFM